MFGNLEKRQQNTMDLQSEEILGKKRKKDSGEDENNVPTIHGMPSRFLKKLHHARPFLAITAILSVVTSLWQPFFHRISHQTTTFYHGWILAVRLGHCFLLGRKLLQPSPPILIIGRYMQRYRCIVSITSFTTVLSYWVSTFISQVTSFRIFIAYVVIILFHA